MPRYKAYDYDQLVMLPISLENQLEPGTLEYTINELVENELAQIHARRLAIVEPVFANICVQKGLDRFTLRTKAKVDVQWRLFALVHNIGKIHNYGKVH